MKSVHLENFPNKIFKSDEDLINKMDIAREICSAVLSIRKKFNLRARLPLTKLTIIGENAISFEKFKKFIMDEANVKKIIFDPNFTRETKTKLEISFEKAGKKFGKKMPEILKSVKSGNWKKLANGSILAGEEILSQDDFTLKLVPTFDGENFESIGSNLLAVLDVKLTEALEMEGLARDFVRIVQNERKVRAFEVNDKINLLYSGDEKFERMLIQNTSYIKEQCLVLNCVKVNESKSFTPVDLEGIIAMIYIEKL